MLSATKAHSVVASQFLIFRQALIDRLGEEAHREHMVVTTDVEKGVLREIVKREDYRSFVVPDGVGGRFSVLSPVGLLSSALVGIDDCQTGTPGGDYRRGSSAEGRRTNGA